MSMVNSFSTSPSIAHVPRPRLQRLRRPGNALLGAEFEEVVVAGVDLLRA